MSDLKVVETEHGTLLIGEPGELPNVVAPAGMHAQRTALSINRLPRIPSDHVARMYYDGSAEGADRLIAEAASLVGRMFDGQAVHVDVRWLPCHCRRPGCARAMVLMEAGPPGEAPEHFALVLADVSPKPKQAGPTH